MKPVAAIAILWGIITTCTGAITTYSELIACRLLLGVVEAGLVPGLLVYLTFFYTPRELGFRIGHLVIAIALAGALGGLLAYAIGMMDGWHGKRGWRWIFIIEGSPSIVLGFVTFFFLADNPETASFLTDEEKRFMVMRRRREVTQTADAQEFHRGDAMKCFMDWKCWALCASSLFVCVMSEGFRRLICIVKCGCSIWGELDALR